MRAASGEALMDRHVPGAVAVVVAVPWALGPEVPDPPPQEVAAATRLNPARTAINRQARART